MDDLSPHKSQNHGKSKKRCLNLLAIKSLVASKKVELDKQSNSSYRSEAAYWPCQREIQNSITSEKESGITSEQDGLKPLQRKRKKRCKDSVVTDLQKVSDSEAFFEKGDMVSEAAYLPNQREIQNSITSEKESGITVEEDGLKPLKRKRKKRCKDSVVTDLQKVSDSEAFFEKGDMVSEAAYLPNQREIQNSITSEKESGITVEEDGLKPLKRKRKKRCKDSVVTDLQKVSDSEAFFEKGDMVSEAAYLPNQREIQNSITSEKESGITVEEDGLKPLKRKRKKRCKDSVVTDLQKVGDSEAFFEKGDMVSEAAYLPNQREIQNSITSEKESGITIEEDGLKPLKRKRKKRCKDSVVTDLQKVGDSEAFFEKGDMVSEAAYLPNQREIQNSITSEKESGITIEEDGLKPLKRKRKKRCKDSVVTDLQKVSDSEAFFEKGDMVSEAAYLPNQREIQNSITSEKESGITIEEDGLKPLKRKRKKRCKDSVVTDLQKVSDSEAFFEKGDMVSEAAYLPNQREIQNSITSEKESGITIEEDGLKPLKRKRKKRCKDSVVTDLQKVSDSEAFFEKGDMVSEAAYLPNQREIQNSITSEKESGITIEEDGLKPLKRKRKKRCKDSVVTDLQKVSGSGVIFGVGNLVAYQKNLMQSELLPPPFQDALDENVICDMSFNSADSMVYHKSDGFFNMHLNDHKSHVKSLEDESRSFNYRVNEKGYFLRSIGLRGTTCANEANKKCAVSETKDVMVNKGQRYKAKRSVEMKMVEKEVDNEGDGNYGVESTLFGQKVLKKQQIGSNLRRLRIIECFGCDVCRQFFKSKEALSTHLTIHVGVKPFVCTVCGSDFISKNYLAKHEKMHTQKKTTFKCCTVCKKKFVRKYQLDSHMKVHSDEKSFTCAVCSRSFHHKAGLVNHSCISLKNKYPCEVCGKEFSIQSTLSRHIKLHTNTMILKCDICEHTFSQLFHLKEHMRIHDGNKPFSCRVCEKKFYQKTHLRKHQLTHENLKPFECQKCRKSFSQSNHLVRHVICCDA